MVPTVSIKIIINLRYSNPSYQSEYNSKLNTNRAQKLKQSLVS